MTPSPVVPERVKNLLASLWFVVQLSVLLLFLWLTGRLEPERAIDTGSYVDFPVGDPFRALQSVRTYGYPLFLRLDPFGDGTFRGIPGLHLAVHLFACTSFWLALRRWQVPHWISCFVSTSLIWSNSVLHDLHKLTSDCLAHSLSILAVSCLLFAVRVRARWPLVALAVAVFLNYQTRPVFLFLIPLVPLLGCWLDWFNASPATWSFRRCSRFAGVLSAVSLGPFLAFCTYRWMMIGSFGLVSFGGYNAAGVIGQFLDRGLVERLPVETHVLANRALELRKSVYRKHQLPEQLTTSYITIENRFNASTWEVFVPAARELVDPEPADDDAIEVNRMLSHFAGSVAAARPRYYLVWLIKSFVRGIYVTFSDLLVNGYVFLLLLTSIGIHFLDAWRHRTDGARRVFRLESAKWVTLTLAIALLFFVLNLGVIILTTPPLGRFMDAAGAFWPAVLSAAVADQWNRYQNEEAKDGCNERTGMATGHSQD